MDKQSEDGMVMMEFRNVDVNDDLPTAQLGFEAVLAMIERGGITEWQRLAASVRAEPYGKVAREVEVAITVAADEAPGACVLMSGVLERARRTSTPGPYISSPALGDVREGHIPPIMARAVEIEGIVSALSTYWLANPGLRLGQIIGNFGGENAYYQSDKFWFDRLNGVE